MGTALCLIALSVACSTPPAEPEPQSLTSALTCTPTCASDADCPALDPCAPRRCDPATQQCYVAEYLATQTICNGNMWCRGGQCLLVDGAACSSSSSCFSGYCDTSHHCGYSENANWCNPDNGSADCPADGLDTCSVWACDPYAFACYSTGYLPLGSACTTTSNAPGTCGTDGTGHEHCLAAPGQPCAIAEECASGYCVVAASGRRCATMSACPSCTVVDASGTSCVPAASGATCGISQCNCGSPTAWACDASHVCRGSASACPNNTVCGGSTGACLTSCASNADCATNYQCKTSTGSCLLVNGQSCTSGSQC
jgi:hypothetical protein